MAGLRTPRPRPPSPSFALAPPYLGAFAAAGDSGAWESSATDFFFALLLHFPCTHCCRCVKSPHWEGSAMGLVGDR